MTDAAPTSVDGSTVHGRAAAALDTVRDAVQHAADRRRRRPWRIALAIYAVLLVAGLAWPRLGLGPEVPATDKTIHLVAFAGLFVLVHRAGFRWLRRTRRPLATTAIVVVLAAWTTEGLQAIPVLGRTATAADLVANAMGVMIAFTWAWALRPVGGDANRRRLALAQLGFEEAFAQRRPWFIGGAIVLAAAATILATRAVVADVVVVRRVFVGTLVVAAHAAAILLMVEWTAAIRRAVRERRCPACGAACTLPEGETLVHRCTGCGHEEPETFWRTRPPRSSAVARRDVVLAGLVLAVLFVAILGVAYAVPWVHRALSLSYDERGVGASITHLLNRVPDALVDAADLTIGAMAAAVAVRFYRVRLARFHDRGRRCAGCGFDLRGLPVRAGEARCPECGRLVLASDADDEDDEGRDDAGDDGPRTTRPVGERAAAFARAREGADSA